jgi:nitrate/nitrite transport system ATP-binding protein
MWTATQNTVFMVTHDVEEAILLSDRIALMTSGPEAELAEIVDVRFPRPRIREQVMDLPEYTRIKKYIMQFLKNNSREVSAGGAVPGAGVLVTKPVVAEA